MVVGGVASALLDQLVRDLIDVHDEGAHEPPTDERPAVVGGPPTISAAGRAFVWTAENLPAIDLFEISDHVGGPADGLDGPRIVFTTAPGWDAAARALAPAPPGAPGALADRLGRTLADKMPALPAPDAAPRGRHAGPSPPENVPAPADPKSLACGGTSA